MKTCVEKRLTIGAPGPDVMEKVIAENKKYLEENIYTIDGVRGVHFELLVHQYKTTAYLARYSE